jgi:hypothetical protein
MTSAAFESWGGGECRVLTHMHILAQTARVFNNPRATCIVDGCVDTSLTPHVRIATRN